MKSSGDPPRLRLQAPLGSALNQGLEAAHRRGPTDAQLEALERSVMASLGAAAGAITVATAAASVAPVAPGVASAGWLSVGAAKVVAGLAVATLVSGGTIAAWHASSRPARHRPIAAAAAPGRAPAPRPARLAAPEQPTITPSAPAAAATTLATPLEPASASASTSAPSPSMPAAPPAINAARPASRRPARALLPVRAAPAPGATDDGEELRLLARAHRALAGDPALALTLAAEHERRFPLTAMDQEREIITVTALVDLGRTSEARQRAERFAREHPDSAYVGRIQSILAWSAR